MILGGTMSNFEDREDQKIYSYQGRDVIIVTVFVSGNRSIAIVEDEDGEQFEVFKDQLY